MPRQNSFALLEADMDGRPLIANIDLSLRTFARRAEFPWFLSISTALKDADEHGLPTELEAATLNVWEDHIDTVLDSAVSFKYVGRVTWNGHRELLYQVTDSQAAARALQQSIDSRKIRPFAFRCEQDTSWSHVSAYLAA
jgi:hypothetical protein